MNASSYDPKRDPRIMHFIEQDFGTLGLAFRETDPAKADYENQVALIISGDIENPTRIIQVIVDEGLSSDVTEDTARDIVERAILHGKTLTEGVFGFCKAHNSDLEGFAALRDGDLWTQAQLEQIDPGYTVLLTPAERLRNARAM